MDTADLYLCRLEMQYARYGTTVCTITKIHKWPLSFQRTVLNQDKGLASHECNNGIVVIVIAEDLG